MKQPPLPVLKEWSCIADVAWHSALPQVLTVSQTFVFVQAAYYMFSNSQQLRMCQYLSVPQRGGSQHPYSGSQHLYSGWLEAIPLKPLKLLKTLNGLQIYADLEDCKFCKSHWDRKSEATRDRKSASIHWSAVTLIRSSNKCRSSFLDDTSELEKQRGKAKMVLLLGAIRWCPQASFLASRSLGH